MTDRDNIIASHHDRLRARDALRADVGEAKVELHPKTQFNHWVEGQKMRASGIASSAKRVAKKSTPFIGAVGVGALLFLNRRAISKWISGLKRPISSTKD